MPKNCSLVVCHPFVIHSWSMGCYSNRLGHPFRKFKVGRTAAGISLKRIFIRSNGWGYPFEKNLHLFERLRSSVRIKSSRHLVEQLRLSFWKKMVICSKKLFIAWMAEVIHLKETAVVRTANVTRSGELLKQDNVIVFYWVLSKCAWCV